MGVRGLTTFIARSSDRYLKPFKLQNCHLVIDGNCVASHLYRWHTKRDSAFGGDYDEFYAIVKNFFIFLKKCKIIPIVLFDGGYEDKKLRTVISRLRKKLVTLKISFSRGFSNMKFFPIFMRQVFCEVLKSLNITQIQCEFEADGEIAALARTLQCPVLSYDSDFYIFDVLYIPFLNLEMELCFENDMYSLPCLLYDVEDFLKEYPGLKKCHLPLLATLLGNDFVNSEIFQRFFQQIPLVKAKNCSARERQIAGLLRWMSHESEKSAVEKIKSLITKVNYGHFLKALDVTKENYNVTCCCIIEIDRDQKIVKAPPYQLSLNSKIVNLLAGCELPSFIINLVTLRKYFLPLQVEDLSSKNTFEPAIPIILAIDNILAEQTGDKSDLTIFWREKSSIKERKLSKNDNDKTISNFEDQGFIYKVLKMDQADRDCISTFLSESQLFMAAFIYWCKSAPPNVNHAHSLLLGYLACQAKNRVGYFRTGKNGYENEELNKITQMFAPFRKTTESSRSLYRVAVVHGFNVFQSILYHCSVLNTLVGGHLSQCRTADSYSGTLFYNIYTMIDQKDVMKFLGQHFSMVEKFWGLYQQLYERLSRYFPETVQELSAEKKRRKRKKKKERGSRQGDVESNSTESDEANPEQLYYDVWNKFHCLNASS